ncbi:hypothetical protein M422DRAFT_252850 [Sphaerobolus stellatus SS14]|uniref:Uncharacterized protein n=1 Tax=Sphaerobolus stellatus (strain SS14) TaxID=990650 RepID=A0A0C9VY80_SPHS4|nr:hypothetical protein M422DRAFT_252850 [Sphaerobolus stellatus SS14]
MPTPRLGSYSICPPFNNQYSIWTKRNSSQGNRRMYRDSSMVQREGEVNPYDNYEFKIAVRSTGKKQVIWPALPQTYVLYLKLERPSNGYTVFVNADACGSQSTRIAIEANANIRAAGVHVYSLLSIVGDLMRDWRSTPGAMEVLPYFDK